MDLTLTEDQDLIATTARDFLAARCPTSHVREMQADPLGYSPQLWKEMAGLGWTALALPEEHGGLGAGFLELCLVIEEMGRHLLPAPFLPTVVLCGLAIAEHGTEEQKMRLGAIAGGDMIMSYARAAPSPGWPEVGSAVEATPSGDGYVLSGVAMFVPFADAAGELLVVTQGDDPGALTTFLVPTDGLTIELLDTAGSQRHHRVVFEQVEVTADGVLGDVGGGRDVTATAEAYGAAATCAEMVGGAQRVLDMTVKYATERQQFGTPIGAFQAIQHHCADMGVDVLSSRLIAFEAIWRLAEGVEADEEVSMAKAWVNEAYRRVCDLGHQVHGAIGFTREHDLHLYLRHAVSTELSFGDGHHHWDRIADRLALPAAEL